MLPNARKKCVNQKCALSTRNRETHGRSMLTFAVRIATTAVVPPAGGPKSRPLLAIAFSVPYCPFFGRFPIALPGVPVETTAACTVPLLREHFSVPSVVTENAVFQPEPTTSDQRRSNRLEPFDIEGNRPAVESIFGGPLYMVDYQHVNGPLRRH